MEVIRVLIHIAKWVSLTKIRIRRGGLQYCGGRRPPRRGLRSPAERQTHTTGQQRRIQTAKHATSDTASLKIALRRPPAASTSDSWSELSSTIGPSEPGKPSRRTSITPFAATDEPAAASKWWSKLRLERRSCARFKFKQQQFSPNATSSSKPQPSSTKSQRCASRRGRWLPVSPRSKAARWVG